MSYTQSTYRSTAFSTQKTGWYCTAAVTQYINNTVRGLSVHTRSQQDAMYAYGRKHNRYAYGTKGNDPQAIVAMLKKWTGITTWHYENFASTTAACKAMANAMRDSGYPSVMFVSGGGHVWTFDGYTASEDPNIDGSFTLSAVRFSGPLYARQVGVLGWYDLAPHSSATPGEVAEAYFDYSEVLAFSDNRNTPWNGDVIAVLPV